MARTKVTTNKEGLGPDCFTDGTWQLLNHPNCNLFHEVDLSTIKYAYNRDSDSVSTTPRRKIYIDSGLCGMYGPWIMLLPWNIHMVSKMMKRELDIDLGNFHRHHDFSTCNRL